MSSRSLGLATREPLSQKDQRGREREMGVEKGREGEKGERRRKGREKERKGKGERER